MEELLNRSQCELKEARQQAIDAEKNIKALLDANTQSILLIEKDGTVIYVNRIVAEILETTPQTLTGKNIFNYLPPELADSRRKQLQKVIETGKPAKFQDVRDGRTILHSHYPIFDNGEVSRVAIYAEDITKITTKERELKRSKHLQSVLLQIMGQSNSTGSVDELLRSIHEILLKELKANNFFIALIDQQQERLNFTYCIDQEITEYPPIEKIYAPSNQRISLLPIRRNKIVRLTQQEITDSIKNGTMDIMGRIPEIWIGVPMRIRSKTIGVLVIQDYEDADAFSEDDIRLFSACSDQIAHAIERKKFDTTIRESEEHYRAFFEDNHSVMFIIDPENGRIEDATKAAARFYGYSRDELKSKTVFDLNQLPRKEVIAKMKEAKRSKLASFIFQHRIADGEIRDVEVFSGPFDFKGKTRLISIIHDITQRLEDERELSKAKESAIQANKTKDEFLANISHEIRTPLNGVMGMLQVMDTDDLKQEHRDCINVALQSSRNLLRVLDDILDLSKVEVGTLDLYEESFSLDRLLTESMDLFKLQADEKGISLSYTVHPGVEDCYLGDEGRIRQILFNLMGNAIKFTDHGSVTVKVGSGIDCAGDKRQLTFTVKDTGVGIPENYLESIFDSFTQVDGSLSRKYKGAGLGLSIVKRLIDLMDGSISIKSTLGEGTSINFAISLKTSAPATNENDSLSDIPVVSSKLKVMLVEDELVNRMMARRLLERMGHEVICAENGAECLEMLADNKIDAILMDIQMPVMDGLEATRTIRTSNDFINVRSIPIIALSAHANKESRYSALEAGVNGYLCKPFEMKDLEKILAGSVRKN
ncbi:PAS domain S-box protein [Desulfovibrio sp. JC010]|uniref:PAS domain S-box protein n=1 Tax=Desulfovibrio sp. JC010 TaxID=2593641 RepID=UPI0013D4F6E7|nr:PAS domain S-box protein [Desulfovibrio sp. JC010]NDV25203.1 PAS domain S-box protein [Desulfovibrio sp. JC010]